MDVIIHSSQTSTAVWLNRHWSSVIHEYIHHSFYLYPTTYPSPNTDTVSPLAKGTPSSPVKGESVVFFVSVKSSLSTCVVARHHAPVCYINRDRRLSIHQSSSPVADVWLLNFRKTSEIIVHRICLSLINTNITTVLNSDSLSYGHGLRCGDFDKKLIIYNILKTTPLNCAAQDMTSIPAMCDVYNLLFPY